MNHSASFRLCIFLMVFGASILTILGKKSESTSFETVHNSNAAILNRLGLVPVRVPDGHHKKRLAGPDPSGLGSTGPQTRIHQPYSRRHGHQDSHVYIVKLPASQPYYTLTKPYKQLTNPQEKNKSTKTSITSEKTSEIKSSNPQVGFNSNGKPGKIYHWNLPLMKKIAEKKRIHSQEKEIQQMRKKIETIGLEKNWKNEEKSNLVNENKTLQPGKLIIPFKNGNAPEFGKRYHLHRHSTSNNDLRWEEKTIIKHVRNNDKRLNYPGILDEFRTNFRQNNETNNKKKNVNTGFKIKGNDTNKMYRIEDSNLYRLGSSELDFKNRPFASWNHHNELHSSRNTNPDLRNKKHRKKAAMSYYAPINSTKFENSTSIQNHFSGNGKPKAFYVMEKSRQPVYYHPLLP